MTSVESSHAAAEIQGYIAPGFEPVRRAFHENFLLRADRGAAFAVMHEGEVVVDIWGGFADRHRPWAQNTILNIFSGTKALVAGCVLKLIEAGQLALDEPVCRYWPEFARGGKERVLVRHVLSHGTGVPGVSARLSLETLLDYEAVEGLLAEQALSNDPCAFNCYHPFTIGWLCGALVRRTDGRSLGRYFQEEFAKPLALDTWIGLPAEHEPRVGIVRIASDWPAWGANLTEAQTADPLRRSIWENPPMFDVPIAWNERRVRAAEVAGAGAISSARSMARYLQCLVLGGELDGVRVLRPETINLGRTLISAFVDPYLNEPMAFGVGLLVQSRLKVLGEDPAAFGHTGAGGSVHGAWPSSRTSFSYVMNELRNDPGWTRSRPLLASLEAAIPR
jgi:CubicO group peptidase (beta-lactamase class C family)